VTTLRIRVKAGARKAGVSRIGDTVVFRVAARAVDGAANEAVRRAVAAWLDVTISAVAIERGRSSPYKTLALAGVDPDVLAAAVSALPSDGDSA
jgi:uncharacterized protein YggU (UPF0235/DUF167 family)